MGRGHRRAKVGRMVGRDSTPSIRCPFHKGFIAECGGSLIRASRPGPTSTPRAWPPPAATQCRDSHALTPRSRSREGWAGDCVRGLLSRASQPVSPCVGQLFFLQLPGANRGPFQEAHTGLLQRFWPLGGLGHRPIAGSSPASPASPYANPGVILGGRHHDG